MNSLLSCLTHILGIVEALANITEAGGVDLVIKPPHVNESGKSEC